MSFIHSSSKFHSQRPDDVDPTAVHYGTTVSDSVSATQKVFEETIL